MLGGSTMSASNALQNLSGASSSSGMAVSSSYNSDRSSVQAGLDVEYANDAASGGFFNSDFKKHDDLRNMLDSNKDNLKLEAMKRIIGMVAKGRDASDLFPAVVKNVVSKNIEIKKLVYVYLVRYAEEQQDLALLSISTFQRALKDPNQLIRASALRVLSSIRVHCIVPIVMLAIKDSAADMSPYVRKTAAHAIPKLFSLDSEQKEELINIIEKLLSDKTTLVVGSAVMAFEEVCPERVDLIHKNYRKLCNLLVDVDEWGQVIIINMLTRYARTQFTDPNADDDDDDKKDGDECKDEKRFYEDSSASENGCDSNNHLDRNDNTYILDPDHRLLLRQTKPLLQSRNASVVMIVAQLYHHIAPRNEVNIVSKALIRLLRSHKEVQSVVLTNIASMSTQRKSIFEPYLKSFFVRTSDPTHIKLLKLEILTSLATAATISIILREFQTYISSNDKKFVAATIQAIGRCAASITEVTETCLSGLVHLLSNRDEYVVAESVVVIKNLLQTKAADHFEIISQMAKLIDFITVAAARASILWLIGEYCEKVPKIAPDVLRKMAKSFADEENIVKLQVLNLGVKLYLTNPEQTEVLCRYLFNLARYDENYDIRDRVRFLKPFIFPLNEETVLSKQAKRIFLSAKPAPLLISQYSREQFQLGSLAHYLNAKTAGYHDLPPFPKIAPDSSVRGIDIVVHHDSNNFDANENQHWENRSAKVTKKSNKKDKSFYTDSENENDSFRGKNRSDANSSSDECSNEKSSSENTETDDSEDDSKSCSGNSSVSGSFDGSDDSSSEESSSDTDSSESDEDSESSDEKNKVKAKPKENSKATAPPSKTERSNLDLLLDLGDVAPATPIMTPSFGGFLTPISTSNIGVSLPTSTSSRFELVGPVHVSLNKHELLNKINSHGLQINYRYTRAPHLFSAKMVSIELTFHNESNNNLENIQISNKSSLPANIKICDFATIAKLCPGQCVQGVIGIDFNDSTQPFTFEIASNVGCSKVSLKSSIGEMIRSVRVTESVFKEEQALLRGMNEHTCKISTKFSAAVIQQNIFETANVALIANKTNSDKEILQFAGQTMSSQSLVLVTVECDPSDGTLITVNCEKMVIGSMLLNEIKNSIKT